MQNRTDILFRTDRFNLSESRPHFINENCFGEDLAAWLRTKLLEKGVATGEPYQEDWGWEMDAGHESVTYLVGVGGNSDEDPKDANLGEWRVMVTRIRSMKEKLLGKNNDSGALPAIVLATLKVEFEDAKFE